MSEIIKKYSNGELTVVWKPAKCIHAAECVKALPNVYDPNKKPWVTAENATTDELIAQIDRCPSGALTYEMEKEEVSNASTTTSVSVNVTENGPLLISGKLAIQHADGTIESKDKMTAFCRCGASSNKPYCDGSHTKAGFQG